MALPISLVWSVVISALYSNLKKTKAGRGSH
jgi:hypothetical protein